MSDRNLLEPRRSFAQLNAEINTNLRKAQRRILTPSSSADVFTAGSQSLVVQNIANPSAPFTTIAEISLLAGTWFLSAATSLDNGASPPLQAGSTLNEEIVQIVVVGVGVVATADYTTTRWFNDTNVLAGINLSPTARVLLAAESTVILRARVSSNGGPHPDSRALRTRLVAAPF